MNDFSTKNTTGFSVGDKVKTIKKVDSGEMGTVTLIIGPVFDPISNEPKYKVMVDFPKRGEIACEPKDLKKV